MVGEKVLSILKNINYETKNIDPYKNKPTSELFGALGFLTQLKLDKEENGYKHFLTPKVFF